MFDHTIGQIPQTIGVFEPQAVAHIQTDYKSCLYYEEPDQIPYYVANISGQIPPCVPGGGAAATH